MGTPRITNRQAVQAFRRVLEAFADAEIDVDEQTVGCRTCDLSGHLRLGEIRLPLRIQVEAQPSSRAIGQMALSAARDEGLWVLVAPYVGPHLAKAAREAGVGYVDLAGNAFLHWGALHLSVEGQQPPPRPVDATVSLYSPKASRVVRIMLYEPECRWRQDEIIRATNVSPGYVSQIIAELIETGLAEIRGRLVGLLDPGHLLDLWAARYDLRRISWAQWHVPMDALSDLPQRVSELAAGRNVRVAFTGLRAASLIAPYGSGGVAHLFGDRAVDEVLQAAGATSVESAGNLLVNAPPWDEGVFLGVREARGVSIAHPVQIYLDTWALSGRAREAAEVLRQECLSF